jgi:hypothetical protein
VAPSNEKSRLLAKARKLSADLKRYRAFGYVTRIEDYEADDRRLVRGIDSLYDLARKHGLGEDAELQAYRVELRRQFTEAREAGFKARSDARRPPAAKRVSVPPGHQAYLEELSLGEARRRARRR